MLLPLTCLRAAARPARAANAMAFAVLLLGPASSAQAQAWVPPAGAGSVTFLTQVIDNTGHRSDDGSLDPGAKSTDVGLYVEGEYALTDRVSVAAGIPYIFARFRGPDPTPLNLPVDSCRCWHGGWQDFGFTARYNLARGAFALTPSVSYGVPSHAYNYEGEAVVGRRLQEVRIAIDAGRRLDAISPKLSVQGRYSYAFVETVLDVPNNRSNAALTGAFQMTRRFSMRGTALWQHTHGGLRVPTDLTSPEYIRQHDRLLRDNNWRLGAGLAYSWSRLDAFASYIEYMGGTNTHAGRVFTAGISWPFEWRIR
jgi:hypothetical protein